MIRWMAWVLVLALSPTTRCNIPVFRYALERWPAAPYDVVVFHRGPLTDEIGAALNVLRQAGANLEVDRVNVAEPVPEKRRILLERLKLDAPCIVALYPGSEIPAWSGPLTVESAHRLSDSPARREIAKRLLEGVSAVWLLVESGDKTKDDAAAKLLESESRKLEQSMKLPAHAAGDPPLLSEIPLRIAFSILRLSRSDAAEAAFVGMLLNSDTGLKGPIAFPVFGRARALWAMAGDGLNPDIIGQAGTFMIGACSCEAKEFNPGLDLLVAADWEVRLASAPVQAAIPQPELKLRPPEPEVPAPEEGSRSFLWGALLVAGLLVAITGRRLLSVAKGTP
jgi:hypothetical protein